MLEDLNADDLSNLMFLLTAPPNVIESWKKSASEDDLEYAHFLIEIAMQVAIDNIVNVKGTPDAEKVLAKFQLPKNK